MARGTTRAEILTAASHRFATDGFKGTSLQDIAGDVGCSKAALLYHFASKEAILTEMVAPAVAQLAALDAELAGLRGDAAARRAVAGFVDLVLRFREEIAVLYHEVPELLRNPAFAEVQAMIDRLRAALARGSADLAAQVAAQIVLAGVSATCLEDPQTPDERLRPVLIQAALRTLGLPE